MLLKSVTTSDSGTVPLNEVMKRNTCNKNTNIQSLNVDGTDHTETKSICNISNNYFSNIPAQLASELPIPDPNSSQLDYLHGNYPDMTVAPITEDEVLKVINTSKISGPGDDKIHKSIIKSCSDLIAPILIRIFNLSILNGVFPSQLKRAKIIPIFKSGPRNKPENYRPISILCCLGKIFEKIMYSRLMNHLTLHNILIPEQFGFRKNLSPQKAIVSLIDKITKALDDNKVVLGVFLDLSKAFDCINHLILTKKLEFYGVRGNVLKWFSSYLSGRSQFVYLNGEASEVKEINIGVPQGSMT